MLAQDLHADRALPGDHFRVVVGMNEGKAAAALEAHRLRKRLGVRIAVQHDLRASRQHRVDLDARRGHGHHDHRPAAEALRGEGDPLRVIAGARRDHPPGEARTRQPGHLVVGAAQLEREYRLQVLALDEQAVAQAPGQPGRELERCFARHVVDASLEDPLEIVVVLHAAPGTDEFSMRETEMKLSQLKSQWSVMSYYQRFESAVAVALTFVIGFIILVALYRLASTVVVGMLSGILDPLDQKVFQNVFGEIMTLLIALEFNHTLQYVVKREQSIIQTKVVLLIALLAIARKFVILDLHEVGPAEMLGLAAVALALGVTYWLIRDRDEQR